MRRDGAGDRTPLELVGLQRDVLDRTPSSSRCDEAAHGDGHLHPAEPSLLIATRSLRRSDVSTQKAVAETLVEFRDRKLVRSMM